MASIAAMSPPAENARPRPVSTAAPIVSDRADRLDGREQLVEHLGLIAFNFSGRASVITAMSPEVSISTIVISSPSPR